MRLYTIQKEAVAERLLLQGMVHPNDDIMEGYELAYDWMASKMADRIGEKRRNSKYPFWAFTELSSFTVAKEGLSQYLLVLEVPDSEVMLTDFCRWHEVLNAGSWALYKNEKLKHKKSWDGIIRKRNKKGAQACFWYISEEMMIKGVEVRKLDLGYDRAVKVWTIKGFKNELKLK